MGDTVVEVPKRKGRGRRALKEKSPSTNEANIIAGKVSEASTIPISPSSKQDSKKQQSFEKELLEMQEMLQQMRLEKEKTEELLKERDEALKQKDEELENRGREQEKLQVELKKLQKLKEFKPTMVSSVHLSYGCFYFIMVFKYILGFVGIADIVENCGQFGWLQIVFLKVWFLSFLCVFIYLC